MERTIGIDDLVREIVEHLEETDIRYQEWLADKLGVEVLEQEDVLAAIERSLLDPQTDGHHLTSVATDLLTDTYIYDGDGIVTVRDQHATAP